MNNTPCSRCGLRPKPIRHIDQPSPYAAYFNGIPLNQNPNATPSTRAEIAAFIHDAENELLDCDADIARVEDVLCLLKQQRKAGESLIAQHKSILSRPHSLPPEVMLEIFRHCLDENLYPLDRPGYSLSRPGLLTPWILSAVCRRWRNILRQSPSYWSSLVVGQKLQPLEDALTLSRQAPLRFHLALENNGECKRALMKHASRWETISLAGSHDAYVILGRLGCLHMLRKLCISLESTWHEDFIDDDEIMDFTAALSPFSDCPQLNELYITVRDGLWHSQTVLQTSSLPIPWSSLSKLTVVLGLYSSDILRTLLIACTNLRKLDVQGLGDYVTDNSPVAIEPLIIHPGLTSLTLDNTFYLLQHVEFPSLTHLYIRTGILHEFLPFISRHRRNISHIALNVSMDSDSSTDDWDSVVHLLPDVIHFIAHLSHASSESWVVLSKILGPKLRTLAIHTQCHLLEFCQRMDIIPLISSHWSVRELRTLEIYSRRRMDGPFFYSHTPVFRTFPKPDFLSVVSQMIEESAMIKALRVFKEEGLEVKINGIPLSDRSALLYM